MSKEIPGSKGYEINVCIPKLNGYYAEGEKFKAAMTVEFGEDFTKSVKLIRRGKSIINITAGTKEEVDEFLIPFRGEDKNINYHREISHPQSMSGK